MTITIKGVWGVLPKWPFSSLDGRWTSVTLDVCVCVEDQGLINLHSSARTCSYMEQSNLCWTMNMVIMDMKYTDGKLGLYYRSIIITPSLNHIRLRRWKCSQHAGHLPDIYEVEMSMSYPRRSGSSPTTGHNSFISRGLQAANPDSMQKLKSTESNQQFLVSVQDFIFACMCLLNWYFLIGFGATAVLVISDPSILITSTN